MCTGDARGREVVSGPGRRRRLWLLTAATQLHRGPGGGYVLTTRSLQRPQSPRLAQSPLSAGRALWLARVAGMPAWRRSRQITCPWRHISAATVASRPLLRRRAKQDAQRTRPVRSTCRSLRRSEPIASTPAWCARAQGRDRPSRPRVSRANHWIETAAASMHQPVDHGQDSAEQGNHSDPAGQHPRRPRVAQRLPQAHRALAVLPVQETRDCERGPEHDQRDRNDEPQAMRVELQELRRRQTSSDQRKRSPVPRQEGAFISKRETRIRSLPVCSSRRSRSALEASHRRSARPSALDSAPGSAAGDPLLAECLP